jgi:arylsulfatase
MPSSLRPESRRIGIPTLMSGPAERPNLVFIMSDQQRQDTLRCYGADWMEVPSLNALASRSFVFRNAYVTQSVCTPARASILTGLYPHTAGPIVNRIPLPHDTKTIAEMVPDEYLCGYMGKWHLGDDVIQQHGFDVWISTEDNHRMAFTRKEYRHLHSDYYHYLRARGYEPGAELEGVRIFNSNQHYDMPEEHQMASFLGDRAAEFIEQNKDRPFVLYVSTFEPHSPYHGPFMDLYDPEALPVGKAFLKKPEGASLFTRTRAEYFLQYLEEGKDPSQDPYITQYAAPREDISTALGWRALRAHYLANITTVDRMAGKITSALEQTGLADNTVVVFTSDHGDMMGDHGMLEKRSFYEEASRVPLLMRVPWLSGQQREVEGNFSHVDLVPTLLDLIGQPVPDGLQGKSRVPALQSGAALDDDVFIEWNGTSNELADRFLGSPAINRMLDLPWRSVVTPDRWKLNLCAGDQCELFDLNTDPCEVNNLFNDPSHKDRIRDMAARIRIWQMETGDTAPLPTT